MQETLRHKLTLIVVDTLNCYPIFSAFAWLLQSTAHVFTKDFFLKKKSVTRNHSFFAAMMAPFFNTFFVV